MRGRRRHAAPWILAVAVAVAGLAGPVRADVTLRDGWVAETPPGAMATGAYGVLRNDGDRAVVLVGLSSPACEEAEMHRTTHEGGVARMERIASLTLQPAEEIRFEPGGRHWMLMRPRKLSGGDEVEIILEFADGEKVAVRLPVRARAEAAAKPHDHSHH